MGEVASCLLQTNHPSQPGCEDRLLGLNLLWVPAFFGLQRFDLAMVVIVPLLVAIGLAIRVAYPVSRLAAVLLLPYFFWGGYASYLNAGFLLLNA